MPRRSVVTKSNQGWKVFAGLACLIVGGATDVIVTALAYARGSAANNDQMYNIQAASAAVAIIGFAYLCTRIRCPRCGAKWVWMGVAGKLHPKSLNTLLTLEKCPICGYAGHEHS
jgi:hypothetical protein